MIAVFLLSVTSTMVYNKFFVSSSSTYQESQAFLKDSYTGRVQNKFYNKNNVRTITVNRNGKPWNYTVPTDTLFFSFINIGDSLVKKQNEDFIEIHRSNTVTNFKINFGNEISAKP